MSRSSLLTFKIGLTLAAALLLIGCAPGPGASESPATSSTPVASSTPAGGSGTTVSVIVQEFSILPDVASAAAGEITFAVTNDGPDDVHEFVIIQTDLAPDALPTDADGAVVEEDDGLTVIDEIEDLAVGASEDVTVTLAAGNYVLICNIFDAEENEAHYQVGMRTAFTVE